VNSDEDADRAVNSLNGQNFGGRNLVVNEARPQAERAGGGGGGRGGGYGADAVAVAADVAATVVAADAAAIAVTEAIAATVVRKHSPGSAGFLRERLNVP